VGIHVDVVQRLVDKANELAAEKVSSQEHTTLLSYQIITTTTTTTTALLLLPAGQVDFIVVLVLLQSSLAEKLKVLGDTIAELWDRLKVW